MNRVELGAGVLLTLVAYFVLETELRTPLHAATLPTRTVVTASQPNTPGAAAPAADAALTERPATATEAALTKRLATAPAALPSERVSFRLASGEAVFAYPPRQAIQGGAPAVVMLHGMCGEPQATCEWWSDAARDGSWLVCPEGNQSCGSARDWSGTPADRAAYLERVLAELARLYPEHFDADARHVLVGFSRGAFVARDVAYASRGRYRALVLMGAAAQLDLAKLKANGITRMVLASGDFDGARRTMQLLAHRANTAQLRARFISFGPIHHALPADLGRHVEGALAWLAEPPSA